MTNRELKKIVQKIQESHTPDLTDIAKKLPYNRSTLTTFLNNKAEKKVSIKLFNKFKTAFPTFFTEATSNNTGGTLVTANPTLHNDLDIKLSDYIKGVEAQKLAAERRAEEIMAEKERITAEKNRLYDLFEINLLSLGEASTATLAHLKAMVAEDLDRYSKGSPLKLKEAQERMGKRVEYFSGLSEESGKLGGDGRKRKAGHQKD